MHLKSHPPHHTLLLHHNFLSTFHIDSTLARHAVQTATVEGEHGLLNRIKKMDFDSYFPFAIT